MRLPQIGYKVRVVQEYDVYIHYSEGIVAEDPSDVGDIIESDAIDLAFNEEGLTVRLHEDTESSNGYIAYVETFEPTVDLVYSMSDLPMIIKEKLAEKNLEGLKIG
jgi:hypothetical protein